VTGREGRFGAGPPSVRWLLVATGAYRRSALPNIVAEELLVVPVGAAALSGLDAVEGPVCLLGPECSPREPRLLCRIGVDEAGW
jgi:hypothetical protein